MNRQVAENYKIREDIICMGPSMKSVTLQEKGSEKMWQFVTGEGAKIM